MNFVKNQLMTANGRQPQLIENKFKDDDIYFSFFDDSFECDIYIKGIKTGYLIFQDTPCLYSQDNNEFLLVEQFKRAWDLNF